MSRDPIAPGLGALGYDSHVRSSFRIVAGPDRRPARVVADFGTRLIVDAGPGPTPGVVRGALLREARPAVGDWVAVGPPEGGLVPIEGLVPRERAIVRKAAGERTVPQVIAAWVDTAFVVAGLDGDFNPRRIERILTALAGTGVQPVVLLNKADTCTDRSAVRAQLAVHAPVCFVSGLSGEGVDVVPTLLGKGRTGVLVGASGAGKSTLTNRLMGEAVQATQAVREGDDKGRHTTTSRALFALPDGGGLLIDTPGMREMALWAGEGEADEAFDDIAALSQQCRFRNCAHGNEPGCAIRAALESGALDPARLASYDKLQREMAYAERRQDEHAARAAQSRWKAVSTRMRQRRHFENRNGGKAW